MSVTHVPAQKSIRHEIRHIWTFVIVLSYLHKIMGKTSVFPCVRFYLRFHGTLLPGKTLNCKKPIRKRRRKRDAIRFISKLKRDKSRNSAVTDQNVRNAVGQNVFRRFPRRRRLSDAVSNKLFYVIRFSTSPYPVS